MKYIETIDIRKPRHEVIAKFANPDCLPAWQKGFTGMEPLDGQRGYVGSTCLLHYDMGKRKMTLKETIKENSLPDRFVATYEVNNFYNLSDNRFEEIEPGVTRWTGENEFRGGGLMIKIMMAVMPGAFKKQTREMMQNLKAFVEDDVRVDEAG